MSRIEAASIRKILDSRGSATVEVDIRASHGFGRAAAPSGASTGVHEAQAFPKGGVEAGLKAFREALLPRLLGAETMDQEGIDALLHELDGSRNFSHIGGNVATATSLAVAKAAADEAGLPLYFYLGGRMATSLPRPMGNIIGGGAHAIGGTDIQEYLSVALGPRATDSIFANALVHHTVKEQLRAKLKGEAIGRGDEGAWVARLGNEEALGILADACRRVSGDVGFPCRPALDFAASEFYREGKYRYREGTKDPEAQVEFVVDLVDRYDLFSVDDPLEQEDFEGFARLTELVGKRCLVIGDDLFVTNQERIERGIAKGAANAVLIKPNQVGTLTDTLVAVRLAHGHGYRTVMSHRSGETTDDTIAHLEVAVGATAVKMGAVGGERTAKLNELIRIEEELS
jgi:enolase